MTFSQLYSPFNIFGIFAKVCHHELLQFIHLLRFQYCMIKDCFGETGLVLGAWTHLIKPKRKSFDYGHCSYTYLNLRKNNEVQQFELKLHGNPKKLATTVDFGGTRLDFNRGDNT